MRRFSIQLSDQAIIKLLNLDEQMRAKTESATEWASHCQDPVVITGCEWRADVAMVRFDFATLRPIGNIIPKRGTTPTVVLSEEDIQPMPPKHEVEEAQKLIEQGREAKDILERLKNVAKNPEKFREEVLKAQEYQGVLTAGSIGMNGLLYTSNNCVQFADINGTIKLSSDCIPLCNEDETLFK